MINRRCKSGVVVPLFFMVAVIFPVVVLFCSGCYEDSGQFEIPARPMEFKAAEHFPIEVGMEWTYEYRFTNTNYYYDDDANYYESDTIIATVFNHQLTEYGDFYSIQLDYVENTYPDEVIGILKSDDGFFYCPDNNPGDCEQVILPTIVHNGMRLSHYAFIARNGKDSLTCEGFSSVNLLGVSVDDALTLRYYHSTAHGYYSTGTEYTALYVKGVGLARYSFGSWYDISQNWTSYRLVGISYP